MARLFTKLLFVVSAGLLIAAISWAAPNRPPANVAVAKVTRGTLAPEKTFIGTVYYPEVSDVSAQVSGTVETVGFEEGKFVNKGDALVRMDSSLVEKTLQSKMASYEQVLSDLERVSKDLERTKNLFERKIVAEKDYDDQRFNVRSLKKKAASLKAEAERLEIELEKTVIRAPFNGIVIKKGTSPGEWLSPGSTVATIAMNGSIDILVSVPESVIPFLKKEMSVPVAAQRTETRGIVTAVIPRGDIATRTFPVKIHVATNTSLMEGMEARVRLPIGKKIETFLVPRDAILNISGKTSIVAVIESKAALIPVTVVGYQGMKAGIQKGDITEDMKVVVKGNERLQNGDPVTIIEEIK